MTHDAETVLVGEVTDIFAHRFVVQTASGKMLADLGPKEAAEVVLHKGDAVTLWGESKPSELKVRRIATNGGPSIVLEHKGPRSHEHEEADPKSAVKAAETAGFAVLGGPRRKPKHFEILVRDNRGAYFELHVAVDGKLRHRRPVAASDAKWAAEIRNDC